MRKSLKKGMAMLLAAAMVFSTPVALDATTAKAAEVYPYADSLIGYYSFDNTLANAVGNGTATLHGGGSSEEGKNRWDTDVSSDAPSYAEGKNGKAFDFQGEQTNGLKLDTKITGDAYTISFFAQMDSYQKWKSLIFNGKNGVKPNAGYNLAENWGGESFPTLRVWGFEEGDDVYSDAWQRPAADGKTWVHIAVTYADGTLTLYRDGLQMDQKTGMERTLATIKNHDLFVGINFWDGTIDGRMDDLAIYSKALEASQIYKLATGDDVTGIVPVTVTGGAVTLKDNKLEFGFVAEGYNEKKGVPVSVNGKTTVVSGSALTVGEDGKTIKYVYTPEQDGTYKFAVPQVLTEDKVLYKVSGKAEAEISVMKVKDKLYEKDDKLISKELTIAEKGDTFNISWGVVDGAVAEAVVTGPDKKVVKTLTKPEDVKVTAAGNYTVELTVTKDGKAAKAESGFSYTPKSTVAQDKFSKVKPADVVFKSTFDSTDSAKKDGVDMTGSKAKIANGIITFAPSAGYTAKKDAAGRKGDGNQYFAKLPSFSTKDFSKGMTFVMDINVKAEGEWTSLLTLGNGKLSKALDNGGVGYHYTLGLNSILDYNDQSATTKTGKIGYYGGGQHVNDKKDGMKAGVCLPKAPYTYDWFTKAANRDKWYTLAVTVAENGTMTTYINGEAIQTYKDDSYKEILKAMKKATNNYLGIGYWSHLGDSDFAGSMDDVAIYKTALSAADVRALNRAGTQIGGGTGGTGTGGTGGVTETAKVSKVSITVPNRKAGKTIYMKKGDKVTLKATVKGSGKYSKSVTWKTSKKSVATVSSKGKVKAKKAGIAKITATSKTDKKKKATITIKVSKKAVKNKVLKISPTRKTLKKGKSLTIKIKKITKKTTDKITYKSSKKSVATVDAYGKVKAKKKGTAKITVKCGKKSAKLKLTVKK